MPKVEINLGRLKNSCFVIMPFSPRYQTEYDRVIRPAVEDAGLTCERADEIYSRPHVMGDIWKSLRSSRMVIAELTERNPNVFYEIGLAHPLAKPVIVITRSEDDVPFDLKSLRYLHYNIREPFWGENLRKDLARMIKKLLEEKEYGTVFDDIKLVGKVEYKKGKKPPAKRQLPAFNLTGVWSGEMEVEDESYNLNLHLVQEENSLSGTLIASWVGDGQLSVIQETLTGQIQGNSVSLSATSYSYLDQGLSADYTLDIFAVKLTSEDEMSGKMVSGEQEGTVSFKRKSIEPEAP